MHCRQGKRPSQIAARFSSVGVMQTPSREESMRQTWPCFSHSITGSVGEPVGFCFSSAPDSQEAVSSPIMTIRSRSLDGFRCMTAWCHTTNSVPGRFVWRTHRQEQSGPSGWAETPASARAREAAAVAAEDSRPTCGVAACESKYLLLQHLRCVHQTYTVAHGLL